MIIIRYLMVKIMQNFRKNQSQNQVIFQNRQIKNNDMQQFQINNETQTIIIQNYMSQDPIKYILESPLSHVLVKGLAETFRQRPAFPIEFLGKWLKQYSKGEQRQIQLENSRGEKIQKIANFEEELLKKKQTECNIKTKQEELRQDYQTKFIEKVDATQHLSDLLDSYFPQVVEDHCKQINQPLSGCYIGQLTFKRKKLEQNNFEPSAEFDSESPKIIEYVGASKSHKFVVGQILPSQSGRSYEVFKEEQPPAEQNEEGKPPKQKKKYLYVPQVQRDEKIYFFKYPRLGSFACFPLRVKSCLSTEAFDKGIGDYKAFVKAKEQIEKQYHQKLTEARSSYEQAKRKFEQHEGPEDDPTFIAEHTTLQEEFKKNQAAFKEIESNPPVIEQFKYETKQKDFILSVDTMGVDSQISQETLNYIDQKVDFFRQKWEYKEYKMLLEDILQYIQEEHGLESLDNYFKDQQRGIISANESTIKEQLPNRQKQAEFQLTVLKCTKLVKILQEPSYVNSLNAYLHYHLPKFKEIIQIVLMLLGRPKAEINLPRSNSLNHRKCITKQYIEKMMADLEKYEVKRQSSEPVQTEYKINKLLERLEKIDGQAVGKYNSWLYALLIIAKQICWARIQCRDAKIEAYEARVKAKNERDAEIAKYEEELGKSLEAAKAELNQETLPNFNEDDWMKTYAAENVKQEPLQVHELQQFLDIQ